MSKKKSQLSPGDKKIRFDSPPTLPSKAPLSVPRTKKGTFPEKKNSVGAIFLKKRNVLLLLVLSPPNVFMRFRRLSRSVVVVFPFDVVFGFKIACILFTWPENPRVSQEFSENLFAFICTKILENIKKSSHFTSHLFLLKYLSS